jgi:hypothetical protein
VNTTSIDYSINKLGFWSAIIALVSTVISLFLPLDAPAGYATEHADRVAWLTANRGVFISSWVNQIFAMLSLSGIFMAVAWRVALSSPVRGIVAAMVVLLSIMAFLVPKFSAVWTLPILADTITAGAVGADMADSLLLIMNVTIPFSLYTTFDYLGFWLYAVFALLVAIPMFQGSLSSKITGVTLGLYGLIYHVFLVALFTGEIAPVDINTVFLSPAYLLGIVIIAMLINFKAAMASKS